MYATCTRIIMHIINMRIFALDATHEPAQFPAPFHNPRNPTLYPTSVRAYRRPGRRAVDHSGRFSAQQNSATVFFSSLAHIIVCTSLWVIYRSEAPDECWSVCASVRLCMCAVRKCICIEQCAGLSSLRVSIHNQPTNQPERERVPVI